MRMSAEIKRCTLLVIISFIGSIGACARENVSKVDLASLKGWDIVIPGDAIESELYAAEEFQGQRIPPTCYESYGIAESLHTLERMYCVEISVIVFQGYKLFNEGVHNDSRRLFIFCFRK